MLWVRKLPEPRENRQCALHKSQLKAIGWKGYREERAKYNGKNPTQCMRHAKWVVDGQYLCTQHAGLKVLEQLSKEVGDGQ